EVAVRAERGLELRQLRIAPGHRTDVRGLAIEADEPMTRELRERRRRAAPREVAAVREHPHSEAADLAHDQRLLRRLGGAYRDVRLAMQQVLYRVGGG